MKGDGRDSMRGVMGGGWMREVESASRAGKEERVLGKGLRRRKRNGWKRGLKPQVEVETSFSHVISH